MSDLSEAPGQEITRLLARWRGGDAEALDRLFPLVYGPLREIAARQMRVERPGHTLQPTALVNEAYLRLVRRDGAVVEDRAQFLAVAAQAIRRILVDHAREKGRLKRGGGRLRVTLSEEVAADARDLDLVALDEALERLGEQDPENQQVVELRFFGGLSEKEVATVLGLSERTVRRRWTYARAWLFRELSRDGVPPP
ncbi:MAG: sigma-70 family RNA polymerase sigma factor [Acidobacteriota bacterium]|jgi:RNA polymerase sigma factor (TIGR02999 family)